MKRIGLIVDGLSVAKQYRDILDWAQNQPGIEVAALIIQELPRSESKGKLAKLVTALKTDGLYRTVSRIVFSAVYRLENKVLGASREALEPQTIADRSIDHVHVRPVVSKSGFVYRYGDEDIKKLESLDLDLMIRCGSGILRGAILQVAKYGVVSLHHGDNRVNRGGPPGFWEVLQKDSYTGFVVQRLTEELDGGVVLIRGSVPTQGTFLRNQISVYENSTESLKKAIRQVLDGQEVCEPPHIYYEKLFRQPLAMDTVRYALGVVTSGLSRIVRRKLSIREHWQVAFFRGNWREANLRRGTIIPNPKSSFLADPFVITVDGVSYVYVEEYPYATGKGIVSVFLIDEAGRSATKIGVALEEEFHLSYPFVFRDGDTLYMCPETSAAQQVRLYRCTEFPLKWELDTVLVDGVAAVDTNIFRKDGKWWMITSIKPSQFGGHSSIHVYHSSAVQGPWVPAANNPVFVDASRGRNGGHLSDGAEVFRVSQRSDFGEYGTSASIHRIDSLTEDTYVETEIQTVEAKFLPGLGGMHHLHSDDHVLVYDFWSRTRVG